MSDVMKPVFGDVCQYEHGNGEICQRPRTSAWHTPDFNGGHKFSIVSKEMVERAYKAMSPVYFMEDDAGSYTGMSGLKQRQGLEVVRDMLDAALNG